MGTDISGTIEEQSPDGKWHLIYVLRGSDEAGSRSYQNFAALAGVRGDGPKAKGLPNDISEATRYIWDNTGDHNASWMTVEEAIVILDRANPGLIHPNVDWMETVEFWFGDTVMDQEDRFIFWFDG